MKTTDDPIIVEQTYSNTTKEVWDAITQHEQMIKWFFENIPDFRAEVGFETQFLVEVEDRKFTHLWKIIEVDAHKKITYNWKFGEYPGDGNVVFELFEEGEETILRVSMIILEDFPDEIPELRRESGLGGWKYFIQESLKAYLSK